MNRALALAPAALLLTAGCGQSVDPEAALDTVRMTEEAYLQAIAADDIDGVMRNYEPTALAFAPGGPPVTGKDAIRAEFSRLLADPNLALELTQGPGWAAESGDLAVTTLTGRYTVSDARGNPVTVPVAYQTVWRKANGAPWLIAADQGTLLSTPATPE